ncbi:MAG TPA: hypothetical protein VHG72_23580 [Polyangia bacterium]|nr:hypothetical protein [Polyangia bacterium]
MIATALVSAVLAAGTTARAQIAVPPLPPLPVIPPLEAPPSATEAPPPPAAEEAAAPPAEEDQSGQDDHAQIQDLRQKLEELNSRLEQHTLQIATLRRPIVSVGGYVDFGFFVPEGSGVGIIQDEGPNRAFPQDANKYAWVFLGDLLAPTVNSRGEVPSLGNFPGVDRFDSIDSDGAASFIVNEVNLTLNAAVARNALATASVDFMPRSGHDFSIGDFMEVDLAQLEWMPTESGRTSIFVGKFESVVGIEYRDRKSTQRFGVTPSLISRYTTGTPLGLKVRSKFGDDDRLVIAAAVTNGSSTTEQFHFYDEIDSNSGKTASGRLSVRPLPLDLEIGVSGSWGPQDHAVDNTNAMWFLGGDLLAHLGPLDVKAQFLKGGAPGETGPAVADPNHRPYGLALHYGWYVELDWMVTPVFGLLGRGEMRDADIWLGDANLPGGGDRLYITREWRATGGARVVVNDHVVVKAEYLHNGEYGHVPQIPNDTFTSSLVLSY